MVGTRPDALVNGLSAGVGGIELVPVGFIEAGGDGLTEVLALDVSSTTGTATTAVSSINDVAMRIQRKRLLRPPHARVTNVLSSLPTGSGLRYGSGGG